MKKIISLIVFVVFYILSFCTCNLPYPEYNPHPILNFIFCLLTIISFLFVTAVYAKSKKFLIIVSIYFACVFAVTTVAIILGGFNFSILTLLFSLITLSFGIAVQHFNFAIMDLFEVLNIHISNDHEFFIIFAIITVLFYATYFISKKCRKGEKNWCIH